MKITTILPLALSFFIINQIEICQSVIDPATVIIGIIATGFSIYGVYNDKAQKNQDGRIRFIENLHNSDKGNPELITEILNQLGSLPAVIELQKKENDLKNAIRSINDDFKFMKNYEISWLNNMSHTWSDSDKKLLYEKSIHFLSNSDHSPIKNVQTIYNNWFESGGILDVARQSARDEPFYSCSKAHSLQSLQLNLHHLLSIISTVYMKALWSVQLGNKFLAIRDGKDSASQIWRSDELNNTFQATASDFKSHLLEAPRDVWRCDPHKHIEDVSFVSLRNLFQTSLTLKNWKGFRSQSCSMQKDIFDFFESACKEDPSNRNCKYYPRCEGILSDCRDPDEKDGIFKDSSIEICHSSPNSMRRYESMLVTYENQPLHFGLDEPCQRFRNVSVYEAKKTCICICDAQFSGFAKPPVKIPRYVYLGYSSVAALSSGKHNVVVGVQLKAVGEILYMKIKVGKLLPGGVIDTKDDPPKWLDIPRSELIKNLTTLDWNRRNIELADLDVPRGHLVTGLYFKKGRNSQIKMGVVSKLFDFESAETVDLFSPPFEHAEHGLPTEIDENKERDFIYVRGLKVPPPTLHSNRIEKDKKLKFTVSSFKHDLGQTTVPFLDIQEVSTHIPSPMTGASFYYKYTDDHSGYLGIALKTYNVSEAIESAPTHLTKKQVQAFYDVYAKTNGQETISADVLNFDA